MNIEKYLSRGLHRRLRRRDDGNSAGRARCVLYVMSRDQRVADNWALLAAQELALGLKLPLAVQFNLYRHSGYRQRSHYKFMLEGLDGMSDRLAGLNIEFKLAEAGTLSEVVSGIKRLQPAAVIFDFNPLRGPQRLVGAVSRSGVCPVYEVDTHNIVPAWLASDKAELAARTLRTKLHRQLEAWLEPVAPIQTMPQASTGATDVGPTGRKLLPKLADNGQVIKLPSGESAAMAALDDFIANRLELYAESRNNPNIDAQSGLSPYLHFGQISSFQVVQRLQDVIDEPLHILRSATMPKGNESSNPIVNGVNALVEELVVRKELSDNYCLYNPDYDNLAGAPAWAKSSLKLHENDRREFIYGYSQLAQAETHDPAWNAAQRQLLVTGKIHGYMRMYWAKKILEWTKTPGQALAWTIKLNDTYSIDGGDPNGYTGIMWSIAGLHDRPWAERPVFGQIRYMNYSGLKRKFDIASYERTWSATANS